jgi:predicted Zn finger-like uncharacterized protein
MTIAISCPLCKASIRLGDDLAGRKVRCPHCKGVVTVDAADGKPGSIPTSDKETRRESRPIARQLIWSAVLLIVLVGAVLWLASRFGGGDGKAPPEAAQDAADDLRILFYHDFRRPPDSLAGPVLGARSVGLAGTPFGQGPLLAAAAVVHGIRGRGLPDDLVLWNVQGKRHMQFGPDGLQIKVPKSYRIDPRAGIGVKTTFAFKGDFEITARFENFQGEIPPSGGGVHLALYLAGGNGHVQLSRAVRPQNKQGLLWKWFHSPYEEGLSPSVAKDGRLRFKRTGTVLYLLWAHESQGNDFQTIHQCEYGDSDIQYVGLAVNTSGVPCDVEVRLLDLRIRGQNEAPLPGKKG